MTEKCRLVFSGSGGQGVISAAIILAEAAVLHENLNAVQTQSYGAAARGGATRSDVIINDAPIYFPKVTQPNVLVCLSQKAYTRYSPTLRPGGMLITDSRFVKTVGIVDARRYSLPMHDTLAERTGSANGINICMLGAVVALTRVVRPASVSAVLSEKFPRQFLSSNQAAFDIGMELAIPYTVT